ncbi:MAG: 2-polyprenyl-3-methyl-6-methoxy-1,4-benzoquinol hydroxylase [Pseudolabrys sp.]|jgi:2-octaprenyl-6-methoxyphenol hydroxylase|nr:2-polyprenyl-3-methyl-6-methoxy-1,4-benzoquinol hydroxylase [Pseudolabrys sp.]
MAGPVKMDVLIAGGGFAGLALAIALREGLGDRFAVMVADPALAAPKSSDMRASAIAAAARRLFETVGAWQAVAGQAQPILDMVITDSKLDNAVRPTFLTFAGEIEASFGAGGAGLPAREPFAHMIENRHLIDALVAKAREAGVTLSPSPVVGFSNGPRSVTVTLKDGSTFEARLLVGADGARSAVREQAGIAVHGWDYGQSAIVTTVGHEYDHEGRAEEHFLPAGPFAILPLTGRRCSIVWTETTKEAERLIALDDRAFHDELEKRFGLKLGEIEVIGPRRAFPLGLFTARRFIAERVALIGDAAHVIHPIAGQGLNMGLRDAAALAEVIADAARLGLDPGGADVLERYQRWRRFDTMTMGVATDGLNRLFSNNSDVLRAVRDVGLGLVERMPALKRVFIREAAGFTGDVPKLLRGEAL